MRRIENEMILLEPPDAAELDRTYAALKSCTAKHSIGPRPTSQGWNGSARRACDSMCAPGSTNGTCCGWTRTSSHRRWRSPSLATIARTPHWRKPATRTAAKPSQTRPRRPLPTCVRALRASLSGRGCATKGRRDLPFRATPSCAAASQSRSEPVSTTRRARLSVRRHLHGRAGQQPVRARVASRRCAGSFNPHEKCPSGGGHLGDLRTCASGSRWPTTR